MQKHIALITGYGWAGVTVSLAMCIEYLSTIGYTIDVFIDKDDICDSYGLNNPLYEKTEVNTFFFDKNDAFNDEYFFYKDLDIPLNDKLFVDFIIKLKRRYDFVIGFDINGLFRAGMYALENSIPYYYFSLEFYEEENSLKDTERYFAKQAYGVLTQDRFRAKILSSTLDIDEENCFEVFNTTIGDAITEKSSFLRELFAIGNDKKIILCAGTLLEITGVDIILESAKKWSDRFVLVLHGWIPDESLSQKIKKAVNEYPNKIFYSSKPLPHKDKFNIFASADIGFVYYKPINLNLKYAAWSSGKFFDFCRCGVPVVANDIPNMRLLVEKNGCGFVLNDFIDTEKSFEKIIKKYDDFSKNAHSTFYKYSFVDSFAKAIKKVTNV